MKQAFRHFTYRIFQASIIIEIASQQFAFFLNRVQYLSAINLKTIYLTIGSTTSQTFPVPFLKKRGEKIKQRQMSIKRSMQ